MGKTEKRIFILIFGILVIGILKGCLFSQPEKQVCFKRGCFKTEVVETPPLLRRGLQFRDSLPQDRGMLFVFPESGPHDFWMKDTLISLDIIWLDDQENIVFIAENLPPCRRDPCPRYGPQGMSRYVLEVNSGLVKTMGLQIGDKARFRY